MVMHMASRIYWIRGMVESTWTRTKETVQDFIAGWHGSDQEDAVSIEMLKFQAELQRPSRELKLVHDKQVPVFDYWRPMRRYPLLRQIALTVFTVAVSSAAAEQNFSTHKFIHSDVRNRLSEAHVEKLVFIFFNSINQCAEDMAIFNLLEDLE
ncbi:hypothetical protein PR003_g18980 [Phytophthora rubi]|uniref:HAT C-terminal dimerisation domain-containing protein n=1 Tax=Phytophthora rubi TaxID=129364 RepID=A0A6A4E330_9STRA|nr:hypothetical protein PR003_g18980 [Phytophthora rubi]